MALMQVIKRRNINMLRTQLEELETAQEALQQRRAAMATREAELEAAVNEVTEETSQEDRDALDAETAQWEEENNTLTQEEEENAQKRQSLQNQIDQLQRELEEIESRSNAAFSKPQEQREERKDVSNNMEYRKFFGLTMQERDAMLARSDVKDFLQRVRAMKGQTRGVTGAELLIPTVMLELVRENIGQYSKLYKHVSVRRVPGKSRMLIMGAIPEGVWTEACGILNELEFGFAQLEMDGYKVGGIIIICNAILEDSDIALAYEILQAIGQAIGLALDKSILYGTGVKMPLGILTRLAQTETPADYPANARPWENLSTTNRLAISGKTDAALFKALVEASGAAKGKYSRGSKFWAMNEVTYTKLVANALSINAAGAIATGMQATMPLIGGAIEVMEFMPDNVIIGGYGDLYPLAERAGTSLAQSEHRFIIEDQTVFKGTARYDGKPAIAEGFVAIGIDGNVPAANAVTFAPDKANNVTTTANTED